MRRKSRTTVPRPKVQLNSVLVGTTGINWCGDAFTAGSNTCPVEERGWLFRPEPDILVIRREPK